MVEASDVGGDTVCGKVEEVGADDVDDVDEGLLVTEFVGERGGFEPAERLMDDLIV